MKRFIKAISLAIKLFGVVITAPVTVVVAGQVFADVGPSYRWIVQSSAVCLVEGVFLLNWLALDYDQRADMAYKVRYALTAGGLYLGLLVLAFQHGEGGAGWVFRAALLAALVGSIYDSGVYSAIALARAKDRNIRKHWRVRLSARQAEKDIAQHDIKVTKTERIAERDAQHAYAMDVIQRRERRQLAESKADDKHRRESAQNPSVFTAFPYPIEQARNGRNEQRQLSKEQALRALLDILAANPEQSKRALSEQIGRARNTTARYLAELAESGVLHTADTASGYRANGAGHHQTSGQPSSDIGA